MKTKPRVRCWDRASAADVRDGLLGYVLVNYGDLVLNGITVRRTADGRTTLSFPEKPARGGGKHQYIRPLDEDARREIEAEVLRQLREWEGFPP